MNCRKPLSSNKIIQGSEMQAITNLAKINCFQYFLHLSLQTDTRPKQVKSGKNRKGMGADKC